jgi:hypothetical protein
MYYLHLQGRNIYPVIPDDVIPSDLTKQGRSTNVSHDLIQLIILFKRDGRTGNRTFGAMKERLQGRENYVIRNSIICILDLWYGHNM